MQFGQIMVKISSQTRKLKSWTCFEPIFLNQKNSNSKNFGILKPKNSNPNPKLATKLKPEEILT